MKEHTRNAEPSRTSEEPWPATETRWPISTRMSPWAFDGADAADVESTLEGQDERLLRH